MASKSFRFAKYELRPTQGHVLLEATELEEHSKIAIADSTQEKRITGIVRAASEEAEYKYLDKEVVLFDSNTGYSITLDQRNFYFIDPKFIFGVISYA